MKKKLLFVLFFCLMQISNAEENHRFLTINEMFDLAETNNRNIKLSYFAEENAVSVAKNAMLPKLDVSLSASYLGNVWISDRDFSNGEFYHSPHFGNNFALEASQVIYAGGAIKNGIECAKLEQQASQISKIQTIQNIRFMLIGYYLELFKLENQKEVYLKNIEQTQKLVSDIQNKQKEGLALKNDITRYELQLQSLRLALTQLENSTKIINNKLCTSIGLSNDVIIDVDRNIISEMLDPSDEIFWQNLASDTAPALRLAKIRKEQAKKNEKIVNAEKKPSFAVFAGDKLDGPITFEIPTIDSNLNYWYVGVGMKYNVASLYTTNKSSKQAKIATKMAEENELALRDNIQIEVNDAYTRFQEAFTILETQTKSLELATQNYDVINNRYLNDLAIITDMLDASNSKLAAELQLSNAKINILFTYYNLKRVVGNL